MGQGSSCGAGLRHDLFTAVQLGDAMVVEALLGRDHSLLDHTTIYDRHSALHIAAANGQIEIISLLLDLSVSPDVLNRHKQSPLMLAAMHGNISCVQKLLEAGANVLMFDSLHGRTCLHYAAYYGRADCLKAIISAAHTTQVTASWGFARFVNVRDARGATPLHLASRKRRPDCVRVLLDTGALVCASTGGYSCPGSTPLHLAARSGSLDCIRQLLAWGADRHHLDASGRIPYIIAMKHRHGACAALLNPSSAAPLVWPAPLKFISELGQDAKLLLEQALMEANRERERRILKGNSHPRPSPSHSDVGTDDGISEASDAEVCCICFDQACTIEVRDCGHQMCAQCTLSLCTHSKPSPMAVPPPMAPVCPFCRSSIARLVVARAIDNNGDADGEPNSLQLRKSRRDQKISEGSSSFREYSKVGSLGKMVGGSRGPGRGVSGNEWDEKA